MRAVSASWVRPARAVAVAWWATLLAVFIGAVADAAPEKSARILFDESRAAEQKLLGSQKLKANKSAWLEVARRYRRVVVAHPQSGYCDDALFSEGGLYREIDRRFRDREAVRRSLDAYLLLVQGYPMSKWCKQALLSRADLYLNRLGDEQAARKELGQVLSRWPKSEEAADARRIVARLDGRAETSASPLVTVRNIRHWTGKEYTRLVIDIDEEVQYQQGRLQNPDRIYFDLLSTRLDGALATRTFPIEDGFLRQIRAAQNTPDVVRIVLDFESISRYNVFSLHEPYRLVVDILGIKPEPDTPIVAETVSSPPAAQSSAPGASPSPPLPAEPLPPGEDRAPPEPSRVATEGPEAAPPPGTAAMTPPDVGPAVTVEATTAADLPPPLPPDPTADGRFPLTRQLGLAARRVIVDPGHGGHDPGTISRGGLREKDLVLDVSRRLAKLLESSGLEVLMTRNDDTFIPLEERTAIANSQEADLFISIHANASRNRRTRGIETYYLNLATSPEAEETAARENAVSTRRMGELQALLRQIVDNSRIAESSDFAQRVQGALVSSLLNRGPGRSRDLGVKTAPFYVLLGATMPSVLVEVSFLSNQEDARLLSGYEYRQKLAESIARAIESYASSLKKVARAPRGNGAEPRREGRESREPGHR